VAQVFAKLGGGYQANILRAFSLPGDAPLAVLDGIANGESVALSGSGWTGSVAHQHLSAQNAAQGLTLELELVARDSPTLAQPPPSGAVVLFDGQNLDAWAKKNAGSWLQQDGPAAWQVTADGALEVVPGKDGILTKQELGDYHLHLEFRTLGYPTNSGVLFEARYESNINESFGRFDKSPSGGFDNCTPKTAKLSTRAARPPLAWQTLDVDFRSPRFDAAGSITTRPTATADLNGVRIYDQVELDPPTGGAAKLGEAPRGPILLQEHGMPLQFRNIWLVEAAGD
jgi:hypothetical protein